MPAAPTGVGVSVVYFKEVCGYAFSNVNDTRSLDGYFLLLSMLTITECDVIGFVCYLLYSRERAKSVKCVKPVAYVVNVVH